MIMDNQTEAKRQEMLQAATTALEEIATANQQNLTSDSIEQIAQEVIKYFEIIPSEETETEVDHDGRIVVLENEAGMGGGVSIKPGNIQVNWKDAVKFMGEFVMSAATVAAEPWLLPFAAIVSIQSGQSVLSVKIQEKLAMVLWVISQKLPPDEAMSTEAILEAFNSELLNLNRSQIKEKELVIILEELEEIKCISKGVNNQWELQEKVVISYK